MLYQPSYRTVLVIDTRFRIEHPASPFSNGDTLYHDMSVFTSFKGDNAKPYSINFNRNVFSDERGYWGFFTDAEIKRMRTEEARDDKATSKQGWLAGYKSRMILSKSVVSP